VSDVILLLTQSGNFWIQRRIVRLLLILKHLPNGGCLHLLGTCFGCLYPIASFGFNIYVYAYKQPVFIVNVFCFRGEGKE